MIDIMSAKHNKASYATDNRLSQWYFDQVNAGAEENKTDFCKNI